MQHRYKGIRINNVTLEVTLVCDDEDRKEVSMQLYYDECEYRVPDKDDFYTWVVMRYIV